MDGLDHPKANRILGPGLWLVLATVVVSGVSNFVNFKAVQGTDVAAWLAARNAVVALMLVPFAFLAASPRRLRLAGRDWLRLSAIGLLGGSVPFLLYFYGFQLAASQGGAATASLGYRCLFLVAAVFALVFLKERIPRRFVLAAGALVAGNALLLALSGPIWTSGTGYVLLATAMWAGEYTLSKRALRDLPSGTVALGRMGFGAVFLLTFVGLTGHASSLVSLSGTDWMTIFLSGILLFGFVATWYAGLKTVDLSVASALLVLAFPITWALGLLASASAPTPTTVLGATLVGAGVATLLGRTVLRDARVALLRRLRSPRLRVG